MAAQGLSVVVVKIDVESFVRPRPKEFEESSRRMFKTLNGL